MQKDVKHTIVTESGNRITWSMYGSLIPKKQGIPILILHKLLSQEELQYYLQTFGVNHLLVVPDLSKHMPTNMDTEAFKAFVGGLEQILKTHHMPYCHVIASDTACFLGLSLLTRYPEEIKSVSICNVDHELSLINALPSQQEAGTNLNKTMVVFEKYHLPDSLNIIDDFIKTIV